MNPTATHADKEPTMYHQCPLCFAKHTNGRACLCDSCNRKATALDLLGVACCFGIVGLIGLALMSL